MQNSKFKVFIDTSPLKSGHAARGVGSYTRNLLFALGKNEEIELLDQPHTADIIHYPFFDLFFHTLPSVKLRPTIVTIHDVIPLLYPKQYNPGLRGILNFIAQKKSLKTIDVVITDSETSRKDITRLLGVPQEKIFVVHLAPADIYKKLPENSSRLIEIRKKYKLPKAFILYTGDINYNKNTFSLIKACESVKIPLVICGKQALEFDNRLPVPVLRGPRDWFRYIIGATHPEHAHLNDLLKAFKSDYVLRLGYVPDEDLVVIYNLASLYCQPSLYEGFGLPILEAMACGCPVVAAKTQALIEIAESAALFVSPHQSRDIASGLLTVINEKALLEKLIKKGLHHVEGFTWEKTSQKTVDVYKRIL